MDLILKWWNADKSLFVGCLIFSMFIGYVLINTVHSYSNLYIVRGKVSSIKLDSGRHTYLRIKFISDNRLFYQEYESRFYDSEIPNIDSNKNIAFYTFQTPLKKGRPLFNIEKQESFYYYPIFYINKEKGILQVFLFYIYYGFESLILIISGVMVLYSGFTVPTRKPLLPKIVYGLFALFIAWIVL